MPTCHLLKPALRSKSIQDLRDSQSRFYCHHDGLICYPVWTSRRPTRIDQILNGGSVYWIINKFIRARQDVVGYETLDTAEGEKPQYMIYCDATLIETTAIEKRPFQGWRYLDPTNAPADIGTLNENDTRPPPDMEDALRDAGLL